MPTLRLIHLSQTNHERLSVFLPSWESQHPHPQARPNPAQGGRWLEYRPCCRGVRRLP
jgi:hypothetical protein